ncbi:hypothetical protein WJX74_000898 [Apatococcus lobatus]|uniref:Uncharacterized protein n=1 Tax=Apatococcus lobatus TaxID=904363 RepID=A0AAW1RCL4_9CHLO
MSGEDAAESAASHAAMFSCTVTLPWGRSPPKMGLDAEAAGPTLGRVDLWEAENEDASSGTSDARLASPDWASCCLEGRVKGRRLPLGAS